jgi:hypothetical protein
MDSQMGLKNHKASVSVSKSNQATTVNRLFKEGDVRKSKQKFYEAERARRETENCSFNPNKGLGQSKQISVRL